MRWSTILVPPFRHDEMFWVLCACQEVRLLGKGAFGAVLLAINRLDGRQYAVKCIREDATSATAFSRLMREVATLSRLQHAHVVRYFQVCNLLCRPEVCTW